MVISDVYIQDSSAALSSMAGLWLFILCAGMVVVLVAVRIRNKCADVAVGKCLYLIIASIFGVFGSVFSEGAIFKAGLTCNAFGSRAYILGSFADNA
jgi:hypothetical protein